MLEKIYRIVVPVLLALILGAQLYGLFYKPAPTQACLDALKQANTAANAAKTFLTGVETRYHGDVYETADNINQQIFLSNENIFLMMVQMNQAEQASIKAQLVCR